MKAFHVAVVSLVSLLLANAQHKQADHAQPGSQHMQSQDVEMHDLDHHGSGGVQLSYTELKKTLDLLDRAREATNKYHDIRVAKANGYKNFGGDVPGMGLHYVLNAEPEKFELEKPPILLYEKDPSGPGGYSLVGVSYLLNAREGADGQPVNSPFPKPLAMWHRHAHICLLKNGDHTNTLSEEQCQQQGGHFLAQSQWMLHAWIWKDSPLGVFSPTNPRVSPTAAQQVGAAK